MTRKVKMPKGLKLKESRMSPEGATAFLKEGVATRKLSENEACFILRQLPFRFYWAFRQWFAQKESRAKAMPAVARMLKGDGRRPSIKSSLGNERVARIKKPPLGKKGQDVYDNPKRILSGNFEHGKRQ